MAHTIRLRGPWTLRHSQLDTPIRFKLPGDIPVRELSQSDGPVELVRPFNRPTGLDETSVLLLCGDVSAKSLAVEVNGTCVFDDKSDDGRFNFSVEITEILANSNTVVLRSPVSENLSINEVWLEIDSVPHRSTPY